MVFLCLFRFIVACKGKKVTLHALIIQFKVQLGIFVEVYSYLSLIWYADLW